MPKFATKNKIIITGTLIFVFWAVWGGQNIIKQPVGGNVRERTSAQADAPSKAIRQPADMRGESANVSPEKAPAPPEKEVAVSSNNTENVTVIAGEEKINLSVAPDIIFYDALLQAKNQGKISFDGRNYTGLGFFVTDIGSLHAGNGKDLLYYINGKEANVGISGYVLKNGDILEWKLE